MAIQLTQSAAAHLGKMLEKDEGSVGLRLATRKSGCSGFAYVAETVDSINDDDTVFDSSGITVVVDSASLTHLNGMTVDYVKDGLLSERLEFINPNALSSCGCGESIAFRETT